MAAHQDVFPLAGHGGPVSQIELDELIPVDADFFAAISGYITQLRILKRNFQVLIKQIKRNLAIATDRRALPDLYVADLIQLDNQVGSLHLQYLALFKKLAQIKPNDLTEDLLTRIHDRLDSSNFITIHIFANIIEQVDSVYQGSADTDDLVDLLTLLGPTPPTYTKAEFGFGFALDQLGHRIVAFRDALTQRPPVTSEHIQYLNHLLTLI